MAGGMMTKIFIGILLIGTLSGCASLKVTYNADGKIEEVWSTGIQDTEIMQEKDGIKTTIKRKAAFEIWPENLFSIYKD